MSAHRTSFLHTLIGIALLFATGLPARPGMAEVAPAPRLLTPPHKPDYARNADNAAAPHDVVFVVDTSSAMSQSLGDIRAATKAKIDEMAAQTGAWRWTIITFRDIVSFVGTTTDAATAKNWLDVIGADDGGDCPNESFGALQRAADLAPGGDVWLFTASSPHGGEIALHQTITKLRMRNMRVYPLILGWCNNFSLGAQQAQTKSALSSPVASVSTNANGLYTLPPGVGAVALAGGQFAPQADEQHAGTARVTRSTNAINAINAADFTISLTPYGPGWFYPGTPQRYTLYATGNMTASNVVITLTLPNSVTYQSYSVLNGGQPGGGLTPLQVGNQVIWSIGAVQGAWEQQFNVQVAVSPAAPTGTAYATAQISSSEDDTFLYNNASGLPRSGYIHEIAAPSVNAAVEKYLPYQTIPTPGSEITYGLNVYNKGNAAYNNSVMVTDALPANLEFITATIIDLYGGNGVSSTFAQNGQTLTWNLANLPLRYSYSAYPPGPLYYNPVWVAYVRARVSPSAQVSSSLANVLQVSMPATDTTPADNVFTHTVNVAAATYDTFVTKSISNCYPYSPNNYCGYASNSEFDYVINFANNGNSPASNVRITDTLPTELTFITTTAIAGFSVAGNQLRWNIGSLNALNYNAGYFTVRVRVKNTATPGTVFTNTIQIGQDQADASPDNNQASAVANVIAPVYDMVVQKSLFNNYCYPYLNSICEFPQGTLVDYYISYANNGNTIASNVKLTDTLPFDGAEFVSTSMTTGFVQSGNQLVWDLGELTNGYYSYYNNIRVTLRVPQNATPGAIFTNTAEIGMSEQDANTANNISKVLARAVLPTRDLSISKTLCYPGFAGGYSCYVPSPTEIVPYVPGDTVQYAITLRNAGNSVATGVRITDTLPFAGATFVTATLNTSLTVSGSQLIWDVGAVAPSTYFYDPGQTFYVQLKVPPATAPGALFTNTVQVSLNEADIQTDNNASVSVGRVVTPVINLTAQQTSNVPKTLPGRKINYSVNVLHSYAYYGNPLSNANARNARVTDTLPAGVTLLGVSYPQSATITNNQIVWSLGTLVRGEAQALTVSVQTGNVPIGTVLTNTVQVGNDLQELDPTDNQSSVGVLVYTPTVALGVRKNASANYLLPGELLTYTLRAFHQSYYGSEGDATNVVVTDVLPNGLTILGTSLDSASPSSMTRNGNLLTWQVGTLERPDPYYNCYDICPGPELQIYARVNEAPLGTRITNTAYITSSEIPVYTPWLSSTHQLVVGEADSYNDMNSWGRIATETGGYALRVGFAYGNWGPLSDSIDTLLAIIWGEMQQNVTLNRSLPPEELESYSCNYFTSVCVTTMTVSVDSSLQDLHVLLVRNVPNYYTQRMDLIAPDNIVYVPSEGLTATTTYVDRVRIPNPQPGNWKIAVSGYVAGSYPYELSVTARASSKSFALLSKSAMAVNMPSRLSAQAPATANASFAALSPVLADTVHVNLLDDGAHNDGAANDGTFGGMWTPTRLGSYQLAMSGTAALQNAPEAGRYQRVDAKPFHVQNLILTGPGNLAAQPGGAGTAVFTVTNHANTTRTVDLAYSQSQGWASLAGAPARLYVGPGQNQNINIGYNVPATATDFSTAQISVLAQSAYIAEFGDYETAQIVARIYADVGVSGALPATVKPGQSVSLTIAYSNTGGMVANGLKLTAVLPAGLGYVRDTSGVTPTITSNQVMWLLPALPANGSGGFVLIAFAAANAAGNLNIALSISTTSDEINLPNNNAAPVTQVLTPRKLFLPFVRR